MGTPRTVLAQGLGFLTERLGAERAIVHYAGFGVTHGFEAATLWTTGELSHTLIQSLLDEAEPMIFYDAVKHNKFKHQTSAVLSSLRSVLFVPLVSRQAKLAGFLYAGLVVVNAVTGHPTEGWSSLMVVVLVVGGLQMLMMGVLGEYLWRALDETRRRPRYIVEASLGAPETLYQLPAATPNHHE